MKCEKCGKEIDLVEVDMFEADGSDDWYTVEIGEDHDVAYFSIMPNWTGTELDEEEQTETIRCPHCKQFPFEKKWIDTCQYVSVLMYPKRKEE